MSWGPSVAEERARALRERIAEWSKQGLITAEERRRIDEIYPFAWRVSGLLLRIVFFGLTLIGLAAFYALAALFPLPSGVVVGVVAIAGAEFLIGRRRFFRTGIESALWIGGLLAFIFSLPSSGKPEAIVVIAAAFAIAGSRLRIAFFGAISACLLVGYAAVKTHTFWPAAALGLGLAFLAALALFRAWRRPSTEELFAWLAVTMPAAGYVGGKVAGFSLLGGHAGLWEDRILIVFALAGAVLLTMALRARSHALFLAAALCFAAARLEWYERFPGLLERELIISGLVLLACAFAVSRLLRGRSAGLVITRSADRLELARVVATVAIAHAYEPATAAAEPQVEGGGGRFGGAGATGDY